MLKLLDIMSLCSIHLKVKKRMFFLAINEMTFRKPINSCDIINKHKKSLNNNVKFFRLRHV